MLRRAEIFQSLGDPASAVPALRRALALAQEHGDDAAYKAVVVQLATLRSHQIKFYTDAIGGYNHALRNRIKALGKVCVTVLSDLTPPAYSAGFCSLPSTPLYPSGTMPIPGRSAQWQ